MILSTCLGLAIMAASACGGAGEEGGAPVVVSTTWVVDALLDDLLDDRDARVVEVLAAGADPHDAELRAEDVATLEEAALVVYVGGGFQPAVEAAVDPARAVDVLDLAGELLHPEGSEVPGTDDHEDEDHGSVDPHVWLDPARWAIVARSLATTLAERLEMPGLIDRGERRAVELEQLDVEIGNRLAAGCASTLVLTEHAAFGYLAARYGLEEQALTGVSKHGEATAPAIRELARNAKARDATTVFTEPGSEGRLARTLADAAGLSVATLDPLEHASDESYETRMRANADALAEGLRCT